MKNKFSKKNKLRLENLLVEKRNNYLFSEEYNISRELYNEFGFVLNPEKDINHNALNLNLEFKKIMEDGKESFLEKALESSIFTEKGKYKILININLI